VTRVGPYIEVLTVDDDNDRCGPENVVSVVEGGEEGAVCHPREGDSCAVKRRREEDGLRVVAKRARQDGM
jgi:hypothetical protein